MSENQLIQTNDKFSEYVVKSTSYISLDDQNKSSNCDDFTAKATADVDDVAGDDCLFLFTLTVRRGHNPISGGTFTFTLAKGFTVLTDKTPANAVLTFDATTGVGLWTFGALNSMTQSRTLTFKSRYTGVAGVSIYESAQATATGGTNIATTISNDTTEDCEKNDCCDDCDDDYTDLVTTPCNDSVEATVSPTILTKGRMLFVTLNTPPVCHMKDINIGVFVTEVHEDGSETAFAHRIIRRSASGQTRDCVDDRSCNCVQFMVDDDETTACTNRTFRVRTVSHFVDQPTDTHQCQCGNCNRP